MQRRDTGNRARGIVAALAAVGSLVAFATLGGVGLAKTAIGIAQYQYEPGTKVTICHKGKVTITVSARALPAHMAHDDELGACPPEQVTPDDEEAEAEDADEAEAEDAEEAEAPTTKAPKAKTKQAKPAKGKRPKAEAGRVEDAKVKPAKAKPAKAKPAKAKGKPTQTESEAQAPLADARGKGHDKAGGNGKGHGKDKSSGNVGGGDKSHGNAGGQGKSHGNGKK